MPVMTPDEMTPLGRYVEEMRRRTGVPMSRMSTEAGLASNAVFRIIKKGHRPKPETLKALADYAGRDEAEAARDYSQMLVRAGYGEQELVLTVPQRKVLAAMQELDSDDQERFAEIVDRYTVSGLAGLLLGGEGELAPALRISLSAAERELLQRFRALSTNSREAVSRVAENPSLVEPSELSPFERLLRQMMEMTTTERSRAIRECILALERTGNTIGNNR